MQARAMTRIRHRRRWTLIGAYILSVVVMTGPAAAQQKIRVVTTLPTYAAIARELTGDLAQVNAIARGDEDPHFVNPRPSFAAMVADADIFVITGLDLELWVPAILDRANNPKVLQGAPGNVVAYSGVKLLQIPADVSRAGGDVHVFGNPHIHTDPVNSIIIARNILAALKRVDPGNAAAYEANAEVFEDRIMRRTFGDQLIEMLGVETIFTLARNYEFWDFAQSQTFQGKPLTAFLGGWLAEGEAFRDQQIVCYHKNWAYFSARFRIECAMYIEPKPGIPASPGHLREVIAFIKDNNVRVLFAANYFSRSQVERVSSRTGALPVIVPEHVGGAEGLDDYFALIDLWVSSLSEAF